MRALNATPSERKGMGVIDILYTPGHDRLTGEMSAPGRWQVGLWALTVLARCVPPTKSSSGPFYCF